MVKESAPTNASAKPSHPSLATQVDLREALPLLKAALANCQKWISYGSAEYHRFATICFWAMISAGALFMSLAAFVWQPAPAETQSIKHWCVMLWWGLWVTGFVWKYFQLPKGWPANSPIAAQVARQRWSIGVFLVACVYFASLEWLDGSGSEPLHIIMGVLICWFGDLVRHWSHDPKLLGAFLQFTNQSDRLAALQSDETGIDPTRLLAAALRDVIGEVETATVQNG